jgi:N-acetyl-gamma-glutamyl-phosphate reductase
MTTLEHPSTKRIIRIGIIGGAGYTGGELLRLLLVHPHIHCVFVHSTSNAGKPITSVHTDLFGETDMVFVGGNPLEIVISESIDALFLCFGHGEAVKFLAANPMPSTVCVIDLSRDFRYPTSPNIAAQWLYGLPELNRERITNAHIVGSFDNDEPNKDFGVNIANPGCFATCIQLGLLPLATAGLLPDDVHITAITGSTGAGQSLTATSHFSWRAANVSVYKAFQHEHLHEIRASLNKVQPDNQAHSARKRGLHFVPMRGAFTRGILAAITLQCPPSLVSVNDVETLFDAYYQTHPFVHRVLHNPDVKQVVNTNKCALYVEKHDDMLLVVSVIDNLLKGACGQAVQNMNLVFGLPETAGLILKASAM